MPLNVLVSDDSIISRTVIIKILGLTGLEFGEMYQASNGREAIDILEKHWVDLVFLDINMPVMNGEEVVETIRKNPVWADLPIVIVSTEGSETRIDHLTKLGTKFVHKPFQPEALRKVILEITGGITNEFRS